MKVGRGVHEGLGSSPVFADGFGRVGPARGVALCYRSAAIPGRSLRMKPPLGVLPPAVSSAAQGHPPHWPLCSPRIGSHTGDVYEVGSDRR
jgi:hypothetical protein